MKPRWLKKHDTILTAYAERASGPGWSNILYWCVVQDGDKKIRREALQPEEMTEGLQFIFGIAAAVQEMVAHELYKLEHPPKKKAKK